MSCAHFFHCPKQKNKTMKLRGSQYLEMMPQVHQDPAGKGKSFIAMLHTITRYANSHEERVKSFESIRAYQGTNAIAMGANVVVKNDNPEPLLKYMEQALPFLIYLFEESSDARLDILLSGGLFNSILPAAYEAGRIDSKCALNLFLLIHPFFNGYKYFYTMPERSDMHNLIGMMFVLSWKWKMEIELRTLHFSILRDCCFRKYDQMVQEAFKDNRDIEWGHLLIGGRGFVTLGKGSEFLEKVETAYKKYCLSSLDMKKEANELLKLNIELITLTESIEFGVATYGTDDDSGRRKRPRFESLRETMTERIASKETASDAVKEFRKKLENERQEPSTTSDSDSDSYNYSDDDNDLGDNNDDRNDDDDDENDNGE